MNNLIKPLRALTKQYFPLLVKVVRLVRKNSVKTLSVRGKGSKKALICYITQPFRSNNHRYHSNQREVIIMADVLAELGFAVDVVDYDSEHNINYDKYLLIIGFGQAFARSFHDNNFKGKRILHFTGANPNFSNEAEARRAKQSYERNKVFLQPRREVYWPWMYSAINSDCIFVLGNRWTLSTYDGLNNKTFLLPVPYVPTLVPLVAKKDWEVLRYRFCWFAGSGALHKGLDLLLEAIDQMGGAYHLDICGPIENENDFLKLYESTIFNNSNVTFHGFIDSESQAMQKILLTNAFVIFPSCSEGGGSSVITCMAAGLIPIVTKEASVEIEDFGFLIDSPTISSIVSVMQLASSLKKDEMITRSENAKSYATTNHSNKLYTQTFRDSLLKVID